MGRTILLNRFQHCAAGFILAFSLLCASPAFACPAIGGLIDFNCDQHLSIGVIGDSITYGIGDKKSSSTRGGYPQRLQKLIGEAEVVKIAKPGATAQALLRFVRKPANLEKIAAGFDYAIVLVGVNNYWIRTPPVAVARQVKRITLLLRSYGAQVFVGRLIPNRRAFQKPFVEEVNDALTHEFSNLISFEVINTELDLTFDGLHPDPSGYTKMANVISNFISSTGQMIASSSRPDSDDDGVYDLFERTKYLTDQNLADTDGDSLSDGAELFTYGTNPLSADTDSDGLTDSAEIAGGTDPNVPTILPAGV